MAKRKTPEKGEAKDTIRLSLPQPSAITATWRTVTPERDTTRERPTLEESAAELAALGVDPASVLRMAVWAEKRAHGLDTVGALKADPRTLFAPAVLDALARAALACRYPSFSPTYRRLFPDDPTLYLADLVVLDDKEAQALILAASAALRTRSEVNLLNAKKEARLTAAFVLARKVQTEAERLAKWRARFRTPEGTPNRVAAAQARQHVAEDEGLTVEALQKRIREARDEEPGFPWPAIMPERRGNRRA